LSIPPFILYNYPACVVVTLVSSAFVLKGFLIQETCVSEEGKKSQQQNKTSTHEKTQQWHVCSFKEIPG